LAAAQTKLTQFQQQLEQQANILNQKESQLNDASAAVKSSEERLAALESEITTIRQDLKLAQQQRDDNFLQVVALTDKFNQSETTRQQLELRNSQLVAQSADMERVMKANGLTVDSLVSHIPPKVEGIVMDVNASDLVEISLGHDDGLKMGHTLDVYRGDTYLGRIIIRKTAPDRAVGQVVKELKRGQIKKGDHVTTKLS
jgi:multidrug efflux pump subunit AcrA (membrane-fusion protein)